MEVVKQRAFKNGDVIALKTDDNYLIETTDTFLPIETLTCDYSSGKLGSRSERWMIGVSCMSGCPVGCEFCATGQMTKWRNLSHEEIFKQIATVIDNNPEYDFAGAKEAKINYTRMGEPFLNIEAIKDTIKTTSLVYRNTHHYVSTVGIKGSDFSWIKDNITLQISVHSLDEERRHKLIPLGKNLMSLEELGQIRTKSNRKTTVNLTLVDDEDFDIEVLKRYFDPKHFFIKLSPINVNEVSEANNMGKGIINAN